MTRAQLKTGFNLIGNVYYPIKQLVLGDSPELVIAYAVSTLKPSGKVLVVGGGGDNATLELLNRRQVKSITLIDISFVLLEKAKQRLMGHPRLSEVKMHEIPFLDYQTDVKFDYIICPFYLDLFSDIEVQKNIYRFKELLTTEGEVVVIDFCEKESSSTTGRMFVAFLYTLFFAITRTLRFHIPFYTKIFQALEFEITYQELFHRRYQILGFKRKPKSGQ